MSKTFEKAVTGFNHNIKHKGKVYHVQTEDSGVNNPHIITHLFVGGNILASKKTSYADILNAENLLDVRQTRHEPLARLVPGPGGRWTNDVWAPLEGRVANLGMRWSLGGAQ